MSKWRAVGKLRSLGMSKVQSVRAGEAEGRSACNCWQGIHKGHGVKLLAVAHDRTRGDGPRVQLGMFTTWKRAFPGNMVVCWAHPQQGGFSITVVSYFR